MKKNEIHFPIGGEDNRDSALVEYTMTIAISIALLVWVVTPNLNTSPLVKQHQYMYTICAINLSISTVLLFYAIDFLTDITSFKYSYPDDKWKKYKYKSVLIFYNIAAILIITSVGLILVRYLLENNSCSCLVWSISALIWAIAISKFAKDIAYILKATVTEGKNHKNG